MKYLALYILIFVFAYSCTENDKTADTAEQAEITAETDEASNKTVEIDKNKENEFLKEGTITAKFSDYAMGDFEHFIFELPSGQLYSFEEIQDSTSSYNLWTNSQEMQETIPNPEYVGKNFKISFHTEVIINSYDGNSEMDYLIIDKLELIDKQ